MSAGHVRFGACGVEPASGRLWRHGEEIPLSPLEKALLSCLSRQPGVTVGREALRSGPRTSARAVDRAMVRLRRKVEPDPTAPVHLVGAHGHGYRLEGVAGDAEPTRVLRVGAARIDLARLRIDRDGEEHPLTPLERRLIDVLAEMPGRCVPWPELLVRVWDASPSLETRSSDMAVRRLRAKLEGDGPPRHLIVRRGRGVALLGASREEGELFGRDEDVQRVLAALSASAGALTLVGPPGIGKSRVLARIAAAASERWPTASADLRGASAAEVGPRLAAAFGFAADARWKEQVADALLARSPALLVVDHADGVAGLEEACAVWAQRAPEARVLLAARRVGGRAIELGPLPADAVDGWLARRWPALDASSRERIVAASRGVPLAVEILASHGAAPEPSDDALSCALDAAWRASDDADRAALSRLALFPAPFTAAAAAGALGIDDPSAVLSRLTSRSWLSRAPHRDELRHVLSAPVRDGIRQRSCAGELARDSLFGWAHASARRIASALDGPAPESAVQAWSAEHANLFAAADALEAAGDARFAEVAAALAACFRPVGAASWMIAWMERVLQAAPSGPIEVAIRLAMNRATQGSEARRAGLERARDLARGADPAAEVEAERQLLVLARDAGADTIDAARALVDRCRALGNDRGLLRALHTYAASADVRGEVAIAWDALHEAVGLCERHGHRLEEARVRGSLALMLHRAGRFEAARRELEHILRIHPGGLRPRSRLVLVLVDLGDLREAAAQNDYLASLSVDHGTALDRGQVETRRAVLALEDGDPDRCEVHVDRAEAAFTAIAYDPGLSDVCSLRAACAEHRGDAGLALEHHLARRRYHAGLDLIPDATETCHLAGALAVAGRAVEARAALASVAPARRLSEGLAATAAVTDALVALEEAGTARERGAAEAAARAILDGPAPPAGGWDWRQAKRRLANRVSPAGRGV